MPSVTSRERGLMSTGVSRIVPGVSGVSLMRSRVVLRRHTDPGAVATPATGCFRTPERERTCLPEWTHGSSSRTKLPGVGVKLEFTTDEGRIVGVLVHRNGRRELLIYDDDDPDSCSENLELTPADTRTLSELLGGEHRHRGRHRRPAADRGPGDRVDRDPGALGNDRHDDRRRAVPHEDRFVDRRRHPPRRHDAGTRARVRVRGRRRRGGRRHRRRSRHPSRCDATLTWRTGRDRRREHRRRRSRSSRSGPSSSGWHCCRGSPPDSGSPRSRCTCSPGSPSARAA